MKTKYFLLNLLVWLFIGFLHAQNVGINNDGSNPDPNAMLDVKSNDKGVLLPRMTTLERLGIANPPLGLLVYDIDYNTLFLFGGGDWQPLLFGSVHNLSPFPRCANDGAMDDGFGFSVAIDGPYAVVSAPFDDLDTPNDDKGSVYIFERENNVWVQKQKLSVADNVPSGFLGAWVAIKGDYIAISANTAPLSQQGAVYIFHRNGNVWTQQAKIVASDGTAGDSFGNKLDMDADFVVIGATGVDLGGTNRGAAYVFVRSGTNWMQQIKLTKPVGTPADIDLFGSSIAIDGNYLAIGTVGNDINNNESQGSVFVYKKIAGHWVFDTELVARTGVGLDGAAGDQFGSSVDISGNKIIVGAPRKDLNSIIDIGAVYVYTLNAGAWVFEDKILVDGALTSQGDLFGSQVAIFGNKALIQASGLGNSTVFLAQSDAFGNWTLIRPLQDTDPQTISFGVDLDLDDSFFIIGNPAGYKNEVPSGNVFFGKH